MHYCQTRVFSLKFGVKKGNLMILYPKNTFGIFVLLHK